MVVNYFNIKLDTIKKVREFVDFTNSIPNLIDVTKGRFSVNGKSLLGMFSLDLDEELRVIVYGEMSMETKHKMLEFEVNK